MDDILKVLTNDEKEFIKHHGISPSDIYDARGEIVKVYHDKAKKQGCGFVLTNPCPYGHRLKDRQVIASYVGLLGLLSVRGKVVLVWFM